MARPPSEYGCWPNEPQRLLLQAALLEGDRAREASEAWRARIDLDLIDAGSFRLLPLLYRAMTTRGESWEHLGRLRGVYRQTWYRNNLLIGRLARLIDALERVGIPTLVLKGVPLALRYYGDTGLRPMGDADLLIPAARAVDVLPVIEKAGWTLRNPNDTWPPRFTASRSFAGPLGLDLDLHWHVLHEALGPGDDETFWRAAQALGVGGAQTRALHPSDQLLHVVAHGFRRSTVPPVRWLADATSIVRATEPPFDWARLVERAQYFRVSRLTGRALALLRDLLEVPVPEATLGALGDGAHGLTERLECWGREEPGLVRLAAEKWSEFSRAAPHRGEWQGPLGALRYLGDRLGVDGVSELPGALAGRLVRRWR